MTVISKHYLCQQGAYSLPHDFCLCEQEQRVGFLEGLHSNDEDGATARLHETQGPFLPVANRAPLRGQQRKAPDLAGDRYVEGGTDKGFVADWKQRLEACTSSGSG